MYIYVYIYIYIHTYMYMYMYIYICMGMVRYPVLKNWMAQHPKFLDPRLKVDPNLRQPGCDHPPVFWDSNQPGYVSSQLGSQPKAANHVYHHHFWVERAAPWFWSSRLMTGGSALFSKGCVQSSVFRPPVSVWTWVVHKHAVWMTPVDILKYGCYMMRIWNMIYEIWMLWHH